MYKKIPKTVNVMIIVFIIINTFSFLFLNLALTPSKAIGIGQACDPKNDKCDSPLKCDPDVKLCAMFVESTRLDDSEPLFKNPTNNLQIKLFENFKFSDAFECGDDTYCVPWIGEYIAGIYRYAIGVVGILATVVMMIGGVMWIVAGGNATRIGEAKAWIGASLTGLVLALTSYVILYEVNPSLTEFKPIEVKITTEKDGSEGWNFDPGIKEQLSDAHDELLELMNCLRTNLPTNVGRISSISDSAGLDKCIGNYSQPPCAHTEFSCHYGGGIYNKSLAIDIGDEENASYIKQAYDKCSHLGGYYLNEGDHIHISSKSCTGN